MIRSILVRHKYGGMACDLKMLQNYAKVWQHRFEEEQVMNEQLALACLPKHCKDSGNDGDTKSIRWIDVPTLLHPVERSSNAILPLLVRPILSLKYGDFTPSGVDFHCSNVLDIPLYNLNMQSRIIELYSGGNDESAKTLSIQEIGGILKRACWDHCSGVNYRRSFQSGELSCTKGLK